MIKCRVSLLLLLALLSFPAVAKLFTDEKFTDQDAILVVDETGSSLFRWRAEQPMIPASVTKLVTAYLAIKKWGLDHRFYTDFYLDKQCLWVKGYGDPMLISEELELVAKALLDRLVAPPTKLCLDNTFFTDHSVPGRGSSSDPYNAPLSPLSVNFNTLQLRRLGGQLATGEIQTPLTPIAQQLVASGNLRIGSKPERVNLRSRANAQRYFGELLAANLGWENLQFEFDQSVPESLPLLYRHKNSHTLRDVLRGTLEYSNNFIANQLFLLLAANYSSEGTATDVKPSVGDTKPTSAEVSLRQSRAIAKQELRQEFGWEGFKLLEGAGLSHDNRLSAEQIMQVLVLLKDDTELLKSYPIELAQGTVANARAKTGTLNGVHTFAGYLYLQNKHVRFVFLFNRAMPYRHREELLSRLAQQLQLGLPDAR